MPPLIGHVCVGVNIMMIGDNTNYFLLVRGWGGGAKYPIRHSLDHFVVLICGQLAKHLVQLP